MAFLILGYMIHAEPFLLVPVVAAPVVLLLIAVVMPLLGPVVMGTAVVRLQLPRVAHLREEAFREIQLTAIQISALPSEYVVTASIRVLMEPKLIAYQEVEPIRVMERSYRIFAEPVA